MSLRRYLRSRYASGQSDSDDIYQKKEQGLPEVPRGTLSGLKTFVRKFDRTQRVESTAMSNFSELASRDESYHEVLKANK
jgi:hypothetical protein